MATDKQITFIYENLRVEPSKVKNLSVEQASEVITRVKQAFNAEKDVMQRHYKLRNIADEFFPLMCSRCKKNHLACHCE